jgi:hypothetical protein
MGKQIERQKIHTEQMLTNSLNKGQNELMIATQNHQLRESEIRDIYEEERISHQKYVEVCEELQQISLLVGHFVASFLVSSRMLSSILTS